MCTVQSTYAGDYDYGTAISSEHFTSWDDGRVAISGTSQQDTFFDKERKPGPRRRHPMRRPAFFPGRCIATAPATNCRPKLILTNTSHSGEQVTITVDGNPNREQSMATRPNFRLTTRRSG